MIVLDSNVISEMWKEHPDLHVRHWFQVQRSENLYIPSMVVGELRYGIEILQESKKRQLLEYLLQEKWLPLFMERILPFGIREARFYGVILAKSKKMGKRMEHADCCIAATAASRGFAIATRDSDFAAQQEFKSSIRGREIKHIIASVPPPCQCAAVPHLKYLPKSP